MKLPSLHGSIRETIRQLVEFARSERITGVTGGRLIASPNGKVLVIDRRSDNSTPTQSATICPFGELITWTEGEGESAETKQGIRGGVIYCGDQNWNITRHEMTIGADGNWLVSIPVSIIANRDDDNEIILPGIKTGTRPEDAGWALTPIVEGESTDYPANEEPTVASGAGKIQIPIGTFTLTNSAPSFSPVACGNISINQCGGVLGHTRG